MARLDELRSMVGANAGESMGQGRLGIPTAAASGIPSRLQGVSKAPDAARIPLEKITPDPDQPREEFEPEALDRLAESLKNRGQLQPIRVRWDEGRGLYVIIAGERRWRAATMAGLTYMTCVIADAPAGAGELLAIQLVENCLREDLKPVEQAKAFRALIDRNGWSLRHLARELSLDFTDVSRSLSLLNLPESVQGQVDQGQIPAYTAFEIARLPDAGEQAELAARVVTEKLTRAEVKAVREGRQEQPKRRKLEWKIPGGAVVTVSIPGHLGDSAALAAVQHVSRELRRSSQASATDAA